jgi:hypothetical protein
MQDGVWGQHGDTIKRDENGCVIDGQHRLLAVIESGMTIQFCFVDGIDASMQDSMDTGARRSLSDQLAMRGEKNVNSLASAIKVEMTWRQHGKPSNQGGIGHIQALRFFEQHQDLRESVNATRACAQKIKYPNGLAAVIHRRMTVLSPDDADLFWSLLTTGKVTESSEAIAILRDRMITAGNNDRSRMKPMYRAAVTIRAWNAWLTNTELKKLSWSPQRGEKFPTLIDPNDL